MTMTLRQPGEDAVLPAGYSWAEIDSRLGSPARPPSSDGAAQAAQQGTE
jgi:hypothetical protein